MQRVPGSTLSFSKPESGIIALHCSRTKWDQTLFSPSINVSLHSLGYGRKTGIIVSLLWVITGDDITYAW